MEKKKLVPRESGGNGNGSWLEIVSVIYSPRNDPDPELILNPELFPGGCHFGVQLGIIPGSGHFGGCTVHLQLVTFVQKQNPHRIVVLFENMYFYCTYSMKSKILSMLESGYFLKIAKN